jgi:hypothetical protein
MAPMSKNANFKHGSQTLVTPRELKELAKSLLAPNHEEFGIGDKFEPSDDLEHDKHHNYVYATGAGRFSAAGECEKMSSWTRSALPAGTQTIQLRHHKEDSWSYNDKDGQRVDLTFPISNHFVNVVPTTEGPHVVDFTHRQFQNTAGLPVVQHINDFMSRASMKGFILDQEQLSPELKQNLGE